MKALICEHPRRDDAIRRLAALDAEIDEAVCSLYGLTDAQKQRVLSSA